jgi:tripartite-type tricarboxylate transporter receptor subunit TctC
MKRRNLLKAAWSRAGIVAAGHLPFLLPQAQAADAFPSRPIKVLVGLPAGGVTDLVVRALAENASAVFKQPVTVENKSGAGGVMPAYQLQTTAPDGYTLGLIVQSVFRLPYTAQIKWDPAKDLDYIIRLTGYTWGIVVPADSPINTFQDYLAYAKAHPGELTYGMTGTLTTQHLTMEQIARQSGVQLNGIAFKGTAEAIPALLGGHIMSMADASTWAPYVESGKMRLLVVWSEKRIPRFPQVPTLRETGVNLVQTSPWGLAAPKGTPPQILKVLHDGFRTAMTSKLFKDTLAKYDMEEQYLDGAAYRLSATEMVKKETEILRTLDIKPGS